MFVFEARGAAGLAVVIASPAAAPAFAQGPEASPGRFSPPQTAAGAKPATPPPAAKAKEVAPAVAAAPADARPAARAESKSNDAASSAFWQPSKAALEAERASNAKRDGGEGVEAIPDNADGIAPLLAQHPDSSVIICIAGCGAQPSIVQVVANADTVNVGEQGEMEQNSTGAAGPAAGAVVCIAGCQGKRGEVIFKSTRLSWLSDEQGKAMKDVIRAIADRLASNEQAASLSAEARHWMSNAAREALVGRHTLANARIPRGTLE